MAVHKLVLDDELQQLNYSLIAIHSNLYDYKLAYMLNYLLKIKLARVETDLKPSVNEAYSIYEWHNEEELTTWQLITNTCIVEELNTDLNTLFGEEHLKTQKKYTFISQYKQVNYFLKITDETTYFNVLKCLKKIQQISGVITAYKIDTNQLKKLKKINNLYGTY